MKGHRKEGVSMIHSVLNNEILRYITEIDENRYRMSDIRLPVHVSDKLRKISKKKSTYASNAIEGNPLSQKEADEVIDRDEHKHLLKPQQEILNYYLAMDFLEKKAEKREKFSKKLILDTQKLVVKGSSKEKVGIRGPMPPGMLFAVYDSSTGDVEYIPPEYNEVESLLDELADYVNTTDDHPLIVAAIVHYQIVTIHPFEDGNGRTARLLSGYVLDLNGYGFNGIGSLEEYFAYDVNEYYDSLQMHLPALYYSGRNNPPHPEIWISYFLRMVLLYARKTRELGSLSARSNVDTGLSFLKKKEKELLKYLIISGKERYTPIEISGHFNVTNRTIINRLSILAKNGYVVPLVVNQRIRSYELSAFVKEHEDDLLKALDPHI